MLANYLAETVANLRACAIPIAIRLLWRKPFGRIRNRRHFLDRTDAYAISFAQSAIDGPSFGHAHFGAPDEQGNARRIGIAKTHEAFAGSGFVNCGLERPALGGGIREFRHRPYMNPRTAAMPC